ncbi:hypothetical protein [Spirosoma sp.]|uniref:hypothetical protein n=1 Tax=Spirosoma sp. TaxID=1899569 RepID=UPI00262DE9EB|nr:hypothetical protein [Spirosoma sp.]MCX6216403.1 hypothetical protein [Spirosoma sp.]
MTVRQEQPRNSFREVHLNDASQPQGPDANTLAQEVDAEETEVNAVQEALELRKQEIATKKANLAETLRNQKLEKRTARLADAADYREIARTSTDPERAKEFLRQAKAAELEATQLGAELNLNEPAPVETQERKPLRVLSTNKAIGWMVGLFVFFVLLSYIFGAPLSADPMNAIGQSMIKNAPVRALLSFTLTFLTVLVAVFLIRVCFPQIYRIWHNQIDSERTLEQLLQEAPAWAVLGSLLALFYMFMQLFASFYQALYA